MSMVRVAFAERVVNCSKRWIIVVVMEKYLGRVRVVFVVLGWWVSVVEHRVLLFLALLLGMIEIID